MRTAKQAIRNDRYTVDCKQSFARVMPHHPQLSRLGRCTASTRRLAPCHGDYGQWNCVGKGLDVPPHMAKLDKQELPCAIPN